MARGRHPHAYAMAGAQMVKLAILKQRAQKVQEHATTQYQRDAASFILGRPEYAATQPDILARLAEIEHALGL